ncbi:MAG: hypothetical protein WAK20_09415 [Candidatus Acidiferrum sp.]
MRLSSRPKGNGKPGENSDVSQIEDRPPAKVDEIDYAIKAEKVCEIPGGTGEGKCQACKRGLAVKPPGIAVEQDGADESGEPHERKNIAVAMRPELCERVPDATKSQHATEGQGTLRGMDDRKAFCALVQAKKQSAEDNESDHGQSTD